MAGRTPYNDPRYKRVLGFLVGKGLLASNRVEADYQSKLDIKQALWVATNAEPRVLEVLPAAVINYRGSCSNLEKLPEELKDFVLQLKRGERPKGSYQGIRFEKMARWAEHRLQDRRTKPITEKRRTKSFRFSPKALRELSKGAKNLGISETAYLERLILEADECA